MIFDEAAWNFAGTILTSAGYEQCVTFLDRVLPKEWANGYASHVTHLLTTDRADMARGGVEYRDGTVERLP